MPRQARCNTVDWNWMDFLYDKRVQAMDNEALGMWVRLLGAFAVSEEVGVLSGDEDALRRACGADSEPWGRCRALILCGLERTCDTWVHRRTLEEYREQTQRVEAARETGRKLAQIRWHKDEQGAMRAAMPGAMRPEVRGAMPPSLLPSVTPEKEKPTHTSADADLRNGFHPVPKSKALRKAKDTFAGAALPEWLDPAVWAEWCQYRASLRRVPWTEQAAKLSLKAMTEIHESGGSPRDAVDTSILNGWKGLFPERPTGRRPDLNATPDKITTGGGYLRGLKDHEADERRRSGEPTRVGFSLPRLQADN